MTPLESIIKSGTKLWLDSVDPDLVKKNRAAGATGATSNPVIVSDLIKTGRYDARINELLKSGSDDSTIAWQLTDELVRAAQDVFLPVWESTKGNDGYVSFELDPLLEDPERNLPHAERVKNYIELGKKWSQQNPGTPHKNRMIKVPATAAGLDALEELCAAGVSLNVTLIFTSRQYNIARENIWRGAQRRKSLDHFKSVYSIFVSRLDQYSEKHLSQLSSTAQGELGILNAKRVWRENQEFWTKHKTPLQQELIFASTGVKNKNLDAWKYVAAFAGSDIETNPPATNDATEASGKTFTRIVDQMPVDAVQKEIDAALNVEHMEKTLMDEGIQKFCDPQKILLELIATKRKELGK